MGTLGALRWGFPGAGIVLWWFRKDTRHRPCEPPEDTAHCGCPSLGIHGSGLKGEIHPAAWVPLSAGWAMLVGDMVAAEPGLLRPWAGQESGVALLMGRGLFRAPGLCPTVGVWLCRDCCVAPVVAPPILPFLPAPRGSSTQLSPESISVTTPLWG